jgi:putative DNA methylase
VPLVRSFELSSKKGKEVWAQPEVESDSYTFKIVFKKEKNKFIERTVARTGGTCILSGSPIPFSYIREQGKQGKIGYKLMAIVAEADRERLFLPPLEFFEKTAKSCVPASPPTTPLPEKGLGFRIQEYGMTKHSDLYTPRQLVGMESFADLINETRDLILERAISAGYASDNTRLDDGGSGAKAYSYQFAVKQVLTMIVFQEQTGGYYASSKVFSPGDGGAHGTIIKIDRIVR